jgi:hypothetical protein
MSAEMVIQARCLIVGREYGRVNCGVGRMCGLTGSGSKKTY